MAWGSLLERMDWHHAAIQWSAVLSEISSLPHPQNTTDWIPVGDTDYPALETFQQIIRSESIYLKFLDHVLTD